MKLATLPQPNEEPGVAPAPCDLELERALLAMVIADNALLDDLQPLQPEDLYDHIHGSVLAAALDLRREKRPVNLITLRARFGQVPFPTGGSVIEYLGSLSPNGQIPALADLVGSLRELRMRRDMLSLGERIASMAWDQVAGPSALLADAKIAVDQLHAECLPTKNPVLTAAEAIDELMDRIRNGDRSQRVPSGFTDLDRLTGGFARKEYHILAGRPGMGKSSVAVVFGARAARAGHGVLVFSLEMTRQQWMARVLADAAWQSAGSVAYADALRSRLDEHQIRRFEQAAQDRREYPLFIDDSSGLKVMDIRQRIKQVRETLAKDGMSLDMVIIDQLSKVEPTKVYRDLRSAYEEISKHMQQMAKDEDIALILLHQLSRGVEGRDNKRPNLADLRETGAIEQDADMVMFAFRQSYYLERQREDDADREAARQEALANCRNMLEIGVAKQRNGPTDTVDLYVDMAANAIRDKWRGG